MSKFFPFILCFLIFSFYGCKTSEDIAREKRFEEMSVQVVEHQKQLADNNIKTQEIENRLNQIYGQFEELQHEEKQAIMEKEKERLRTLTEVTERLKIMEDKVEDLESKLQAQNDFIGTVTGALKEIKGGKLESLQKANKKNDSLYYSAKKAFDNKKFAEAKDKFTQLLATPNTSAVRMVRAWHALGIINFQDKNYNDAMVFFSKIYAQYPKSSRAPSSLLYIAKSFIATDQKADAKGSLNQVINQYPKTSEAKEARSLLKDL